MFNQKQTRVVSVLVCLSVSLTARSVVAAEPPDKTLSPYFFVENGDPSVDAMPLEKTMAEVEVSAVIANVKVTQTYVNKGQRPINAKYVFPASTRAAVHGLTMRVGDQVIKAKIKKRSAAKAEFERAKDEGKTATLLQQERPNVFTMALSNVMPGDRVEVELRYTELLVPSEGVYEFVYPTVVGPRYSEADEASAADSDQWIKSPYLAQGSAPSYDFDLKATIAAPLPIKALHSPSHQISADYTDPSTVGIGLSDKRAGNRDFIVRYKLSGDNIASGLTLQQSEGENFFLLMAQPPKRVTPELVPPREYVFVIDVSGSMSGFPLDTAKALIRTLVGGFRRQDSFNVVLFSGGANVMSPRSVPASVSNVSRAVSTIDSLWAGGGTNLLEALKTSMALPQPEGVSRNFIVITDGYIGAERDVFDYVRDNLGEANVFSFGIGSGVNRHLIEGIAKAGVGEGFVLTDSSNAARVSKRFHDYVKSPVLTDIRLDFGDFKVYDVQPNAVPDLLAGRPVIVHGKWSGARAGAITVSGQSGSGPYKQSFDVGAASVKKSGSLNYLWARSRIDDLSFGTVDKRRQEEITALGLHYNLLTEFTSFIAVLDVVRNVGPSAVSVQQPLPLPLGVSNLAVGGQVQSGAEPELVFLAACMVCVLVVFGHRQRLWAR